MIPEKAVERIREELDNCQNPLFFFHDDPDGTSSYIQCYRYKREGYGNMVKMVPRMTVDHLNWIKRFGCDKAFVFDIAMMDQEFAAYSPVPIVWLDHHEIQDVSGVVYINARSYQENTPPSVMCYQACQKDLWLACVGAIGDWYWTDLLYALQKQHPSLMEIDLASVDGRPEEVMFNTPLGVLVHVLSFNLKGTSKAALRNIKQYMDIENPMEILEQSSDAGRNIWENYKKVKQYYDEEKKKAQASYKKDDPFFVHTYTTNAYSVTKDLANELSYLYKDKVIVLARERNGAMVMSLRSSREGPVLNKALVQVIAQFSDAHGGGHEHACGASVRSTDFQDFLKAFKEALSTPRKP